MPQVSEISHQGRLYAQDFGPPTRSTPKPKPKPEKKQTDQLDFLPEKGPGANWLSENKGWVGGGVTLFFGFLAWFLLKSNDADHYRGEVERLQGLLKQQQNIVNTTVGKPAEEAQKALVQYQGDLTTAQIRLAKLKGYDAAKRFDGREALAQKYANLSDANAEGYDAAIQKLKQEIGGLPAIKKDLQDDLRHAELMMEAARKTPDQADDAVALQKIQDATEAIGLHDKQVASMQKELDLLKAKYTNALGNKKILETLEKKVKDAQTRVAEAKDAASSKHAIQAVEDAEKELAKFQDDMASGALKSAKYSRPVSGVAYIREVSKGCLFKLALLAGAGYAIWKWGIPFVEGLFSDDPKPVEKPKPRGRRVAPRTD